MSKEIATMYKLCVGKGLSVKDSLNLIRIFKQSNGKSYENLEKKLKGKGFDVKIRTDFLNLQKGAEKGRFQIYKGSNLIANMNLSA